MREETKVVIRRVGFLVVALGITLAFMFPLVWVVLASLKTRLEIFVLPPK
jgi:ABC-type glycerol-3-phosphate transport system permease component